MRRTRMKSKKPSFFGTFFKERKMIGAVRPSSAFLMQKMLDPIDFSTAKVIVELGPGTGVFTHALLDRMSNDCKLLAFELNDIFAENLQKSIHDERFTLIHDSAEKISHYLHEMELGEVDYIISSLPLTAIPPAIRTAILKASHASLKTGGYYIQFQYSLHLRKKLKQLFKTQQIRFTLLNVPPAFVYVCCK